MTDIVDRLRRAWPLPKEGALGDLHEAANEIVRLRAEIARLKESAMHWAGKIAESNGEPIGYCSEYVLTTLAGKAHHYCLSVSKARENEFQHPIYSPQVRAGGKE